MTSTYTSAFVVRRSQTVSGPALIVPNLERLLEFCQKNRISLFLDMNDLVMHEPVQRLFRAETGRYQQPPCPYETIKSLYCCQ